MSIEKVEIRFEIPASEISVCDGYCSATGKTRKDIFRALLKSWSDGKRREATLVCRVAGINPTVRDADRGLSE